MKNLFKVTFAMLIASLTLVGCSKNSSEINESPKNVIVDNSINDAMVNSTQSRGISESESFFRKNIAIIDARVRSINKEKFVREVYLANFSKQEWDKDSIGIEGYPFSDNGMGNDLVAKDGIFTSLEEYYYSEEENVEYNGKYLKDSFLDTVYRSIEFQHQDELEILYNDYLASAEENSLKKKKNGEIGIHVSGHCESVSFCESGCIADWIWDELDCICFTNCGDIDFSFDFSFGF